MTRHEKYVKRLENDLAIARDMLGTFLDPGSGLMKIMGVKPVRGGGAAKVQRFLKKPFPTEK